MVNKPLVSIVSAGLSKFGRLDGMYCRELFADAAKEAYDRCPNLNPIKDIEALFVGHMGESYEHQGHTGPTVADWAGLLPKPAVRLESACASSGVALRTGILAILSGLHKIVMADSLLRQLFYNLIDDTLKHGEKVSQIRVYYEEGEDQLKLIYEDDGVGIPNDEKEKIFNEGYGKGTGYGLYLITKICETYGWTIQETGVPGKGAQFTMTIPKTNKNGKIPYRFDNK